MSSKSVIALLSLLRWGSYDPPVGLDIAIDRDACIGSGNCGFLAPGVFDLDDDSIAVVVDPDAAPETDVVTAAERCPGKAIAVRRDGTLLF